MPRLNIPRGNVNTCILVTEANSEDQDVCLFVCLI